MRAVLDITDTAYYLHTTSDAVRDLVKTGQIPYKKRGDKIIFIVRELDAWLEALPGLTLPDVIKQTRLPATYSATPLMETLPDTPAGPILPTPIKLTRGRRTHVSAASQQEQTR